jgi:hypothetical protein
MAVAAALQNTPLLQFNSSTDHPLVQQIQDLGGLPYIAYAPSDMEEDKRAQSRPVVLTIISRGLASSSLLNDHLLTHVFLSRTATACALKSCSPARASETFLQHNRTTELLELLDVLPGAVVISHKPVGLTPFSLLRVRVSIAMPSYDHHLIITNPHCKAAAYLATIDPNQVPSQATQSLPLLLINRHPSVVTASMA